jgi:5,5'-dehydrodivanillate O-demethylase
MSVTALDKSGNSGLASRTVNPSHYLDEFPLTGPDTLGGKYMRQFWQVVGRSVDLPVGKAKPIKIMSVDYTLYRGASGVAHVVDLLCAHRGAQLSAGWVEGDEIRCPYHGWKFGADGVCTERPGELGRSGGGMKVGAYPTNEFLGLIYAYFGEGEPPAFPPYPAFEGEGVNETYGAVFGCNYFQGWENDWDLYHARYTHVTGGLHTIDFDMAMSTEVYNEVDYGVHHTMQVGDGLTYTSILLMPATVQLIIPTFNEQRRKRGQRGPLFRPSYLVHVPIDDYSHAAYLTQLVPIAPEDEEDYRAQYEAVQKIRADSPATSDVAAEILRGEKTIEDAKLHPMLIEIEDLVTQVGQGKIANRHIEHLGRTDVGIALLRRIFARELHAVAEGRATKPWTMCPLINIDGWNA